MQLTKGRIMYKIAICDDDKRYRKTIREIVEHENSLPENEIRFYEYESGNELLKHTDILHELVFIDIRMPGLDGNQTALKLRNYNKDAVLIFYSSYFEPTVDSINFGQPFRYIMKDLHDTSLRREIEAIVINSNGKVEQYWNVWLLINNVISHKDSDEYVLNLEIKNVLSDIWYMKLETQIPMVQELIRGTVSASNLLTNGYLSPEELLVQGSDTVIFLEHVTKVIKHDSKVAVLGARTGLAVEMLLNNNLDRNVELTLIDESAGMLKRAEERLRRYDVQFEYYHFEDGLLEKSLLGQFDFVIALGELHRYKNPLHGLHVANMLLKAKGQLLALEYEELDPMSIISSAILENGFSEYMRKRKNTALMTVDEYLVPLAITILLS